MEEALMDALLCASDRLAEALRAGLAAGGREADFQIRIQGNRATIGSSSRALALSERGAPGAPPAGTLALSARSAVPSLVDAFRQELVETR